MVRKIPRKDEYEIMNIRDTVTHLLIIPEVNSRVLRTVSTNFFFKPMQRPSLGDNDKVVLLCL